MTFSVLHVFGDSHVEDVVSGGVIASLLSELDGEGVAAEHGDVWLADEASGWSLGVFAGERGLVVLEHDEHGASHRVGLERAEAFRLLERFAAGEDVERDGEWSPGYGGD